MIIAVTLLFILGQVYFEFIIFLDDDTKETLGLTMMVVGILFFLLVHGFYFNKRWVSAPEEPKKSLRDDPEKRINLFKKYFLRIFIIAISIGAIIGAFNFIAGLSATTIIIILLFFILIK